MKSRQWIIAGALSGLLGLAGTCGAKQAEPVTDLAQALERAKTENKLLFIQYGREACGNCKALKNLIRGGQLKLRDTQFVYADISCDDKATRQIFNEKFKVEGNTLPFVIVADPCGKQLVSRTGYGEANEFDRLIGTAEKKMRQAGAATGATAATGPVVGSSRLSMPRPILPDETREPRTWTSRSGSTIEASLVEVPAPFVVLKKADGGKVKILQADLSDEDQAYIAALRTASPTP
ncbi:MAG: hypothetical protein KKC51_06310 [Verrucomicrobia bacterium]|nr:hypothetical protein [Verrucomicrobiota bacterium]